MKMSYNNGFNFDQSSTVYEYKLCYDLSLHLRRHSDVVLLISEIYGLVIVAELQHIGIGI